CSISTAPQAPLRAAVRAAAKSRPPNIRTKQKRTGGYTPPAPLISQSKAPEPPRPPPRRSWVPGPIVEVSGTCLTCLPFAPAGLVLRHGVDQRRDALVQRSHRPPPQAAAQALRATAGDRR